MTVWHQDKLKQNDYLGAQQKKNQAELILRISVTVAGGLILGLNAKGERLRHWANLVRHPVYLVLSQAFSKANLVRNPSGML